MNTDEEIMKNHISGALQKVEDKGWVTVNKNLNRDALVSTVYENIKYGIQTTLEVLEFREFLRLERKYQDIRDKITKHRKMS